MCGVPGSTHSGEGGAGVGEGQGDIHGCRLGGGGARHTQ
jgi:hypothetical protein